MKIPQSDYPQLLKKTGDLEVIDSWEPIIRSMFDSFEYFGCDIVVLQLKEKFGDLRVYLHLGSDISEEVISRINANIRLAQHHCMEVCAECGSTDSVSLFCSEDKPWWLYRCKTCRMN